MDTDVYSYLRTHATELGSRILETYPPLQGTKDPVAPRIATLLRKALPAQALAITGTAKASRHNKLTYLFQRRHEGVVPFTVKVGSFEIQRSQFRVAYLCSCGVAPRVQFGADFQP